MPAQWREIADDLRRRIAAGEIKPGEQLPSQSQWAKQGVGVQVIKDAMEALAVEGVIERRRGAGYFALPIPPDPVGWQAWRDQVTEQLAEIPELKRRIAELEQRGE
ncbi:winged helix-turn-helix domain-containing protein [Kineosporia succinea]|uniref:DNA-binding GntR family transcriptional regulator n=1 Tax=Kineosporia succinea TaxID=84632 RepID=A0ABT9P9J9_9ACTN|nr:winged helix-turn-helix domain-containing protein [Kineosporia succinea]MDP9829378.1 DNA-binding GntR family transcriptional regulator [Kineosporia succinea]